MSFRDLFSRPPSGPHSGLSPEEVRDLRAGELYKIHFRKKLNDKDVYFLKDNFARNQTLSAVITTCKMDESTAEILAKAILKSRNPNMIYSNLSHAPYLRMISPDSSAPEYEDRSLVLRELDAVCKNNRDKVFYLLEKLLTAKYVSRDELEAIDRRAYAIGTIMEYPEKYPYHNGKPLTPEEIAKIQDRIEALGLEEEETSLKARKSHALRRLERNTDITRS